jgi:AraC family transcriptional activator of pobA
MSDKGLISFSLEALGEMQLLPEENFLTFQGCFFARVDSMMDEKIDILRYPCRINAYIALLCIEGSVEVIWNLKQYTIKKNCIFISFPKDIIQLSKWNECKLYIIAFDDNFIRNTKVDFNVVQSIFIGIQNHPYLELLPEEANCLEESFSSLILDIGIFEGKYYYDEIGVSYINLITYKTSSFIKRHLETQPEETGVVNKRSIEYYNKFMSLLNQYFRSERSIEFYASKLYITPKYMTTLINKISGKSAMEWINEYVVMEAKHLLKYSEMSIQEISDYLNFSNQSFFAQYFKRFSGSTPSGYRTKPK